MTRKQIVPIKIYFSPSISFTIRTVVLWKIRESIWNFLLVNINIIFAIFDLLRKIWVQFWTFWLFFFQTGRFIEREAGMADFSPLFYFLQSFNLISFLSFVLFLAVFQLNFLAFWGLLSNPRFFLCQHSQKYSFLLPWKTKIYMFWKMN